MHKLLSRLLFGIIWFLSLPPLRLLYMFSFLARILLQYIIKYRRSVIYNNIRTSFPELSPEEVRIFAGKYYNHISRVMVEAVKAMHWSTEKMRSRIRLTNPGLLDELSSAGKNIIVLAGHTGNWEWLPALISPYGFDLLGVYKPQTSKTFNELSIMMRQKEGVIPIAMRETARAIKQTAGYGRPRALLLIADQIPARPDIHFWETFLNQSTAWFTGGEKIAIKYDLPVMFMRMERTGAGRYQGTVIPVSMTPGKEKEGAITRKYVSLLEENILYQPENWLWSHRRWKHQPEDLSLQEWPK